MNQKNLVEVAAVTDQGVTPLGIMNVEQAKALDAELDFVVSTPGDVSLVTSTNDRPDVGRQDHGSQPRASGRS